MKLIKIFAFAMALTISSVSFAQMSNNDIVKYAKTASSQGKSEKEIAKELVQKGVPVSQLEQIVNGATSHSVTEQAVTGTLSNRKTHDEVLNQGSELTEYIPVNDDELTADQIFGHDIFRSRSLTFEPNENSATPESYKLGPGDELNIVLWGDNEATINQTINAEGNIFISQIGRIQLSGMTINAAQTKISRLLRSKYANIGGGTSVSISLARIRTIVVNVMGDVVAPGTYRLSSFSSVFNAIYRAGGVTGKGTMRAIKVVRGAKDIAEVDIYGYLFDGKSDSDITLQDGDIIIVPSYVNLVSVGGEVKRPMIYEMAKGETLSDLIEYAGGFSSEAYPDDFSVLRKSGKFHTAYTVSSDETDSFCLADGDEVTVSSTRNRFENRLEIRGCITRPGIYELGNDIRTVRQLISKAGGLTEDAFTSRSLILREKDDLSLEMVSINLKNVLNGVNADIELKNNDILLISSIHEVEDRGTLSIIGNVAEPGTFPFSENTTVEDMILQAGGLRDGASMARIDVARRLKNVNSTSPTDIIGESFSFAIKDGLVCDGGDSFFLEPYDVVIVRQSPSYLSQSYVNIKGEVAFQGQYVLTSRGERLTDLINRAGGLSEFANLQGVRIERLRDEADADVTSTLNQLTLSDSLSAVINNETSYFVATNLEQALKNPGSAYDIILKPGDRIFIPQIENTVKIEGEVMFPAAVAFQGTGSANKYVNMAGGFTDNANRRKVYIVYADGHAVRARRPGARVEQGCIVVVPTKKKRERMSSSDILAATSVTTSLITAGSLIFNIIKNSSNNK